MTTGREEWRTGASLGLVDIGGGRFTVSSLGDPAVRDVVFGGQLLAQTIVAAGRCHPGKQVRSVQTIFLRAARILDPLVLEVTTVHEGRSFASASVVASQGDRVCVTSQLLLDVPDPDLIRHGTRPPEVPGPDGSPPFELVEKVVPGSELRVVGGVDTGGPAAGPAELHLWTRTPDATDDACVNQAILAFATIGFLVRTAMLPHDGIGGDEVHSRVSTSVLAHDLTFHEPVRVRDWLLLSHRSPHAGGGRAYGTVEVFTEDGSLVATANQESMIRGFSDPSNPAAEGTRLM